jgi:hypothetical protein
VAWHGSRYKAIVETILKVIAVCIVVWGVAGMGGPVKQVKFETAPAARQINATWANIEAETARITELRQTAGSFAKNLPAWVWEGRWFSRN